MREEPDVHTTRLNEYLYETATTIGAEPEPDTKDAPKTKVVKNSSKGVRTK